MEMSFGTSSPTTTPSFDVINCHWVYDDSEAEKNAQLLKSFC